MERKRVIPHATDRKDAVFVEWRGSQRRLVDVCREMGVDMNLVRARLGLHWTLDRAVTTPKHEPSPNMAPPQPRGPQRSPLRRECERLFRLGWSFDAVMRRTEAPQSTIRNALKDSKLPQSK